MFVKLTSQYKGRFPVDVGGLVLNGFGAKETDDKTGVLILKGNPGILVQCSRTGEVAGEVKVEVPQTGIVKDDTLPTPQKPETQVEADGSDVVEPVASAHEGENTGLDIEVVRTKKGKGKEK